MNLDFFNKTNILESTLHFFSSELDIKIAPAAKSDDYSGKNGATHSGAFGASIPVHSAPPPKWRKLGLETGE